MLPHRSSQQSDRFPAVVTQDVELTMNAPSIVGDFNELQSPSAITVPLAKPSIKTIGCLFF